MPLPRPPTQAPAQRPAQKSVNNPAAKAIRATKATKATKANNELAIKGILCILIGLGVVVSPYFITSPGMQGIVAKSAAVGWFALVLGLAFVGLYARRRMAGKTG